MKKLINFVLRFFAFFGIFFVIYVFFGVGFQIFFENEYIQYRHAINDILWWTSLGATLLIMYKTKLIKRTKYDWFIFLLIILVAFNSCFI